MSGAERLGATMKVGYVPDSFGQSAQMPQIYNGFGIKKCFFRRGKSSSQFPEAEFYWKGRGNSKVFTHNIVDYGNMINPPRDRYQLEEYLNSRIDELGTSSIGDHIILMNGQDQRPVRKDILKIIETAQDLGFDIELAHLEDVLEEMENKSKTDCGCYEGEFTFGEKSRVHKSIFSTRADLKILNNRLENKIVNILEPMCAIGDNLGIPYNHRLFEKIWKLLLKNSAHDSIGMCNSDQVNQQIKNRFEKANDIADQLFELTARLIGQSVIEKNIFQFQVYNYLPYRVNDILTITIFTPSASFKIVDEVGKEYSHYVLECKDVTKDIYEDAQKEIGVNGEYEPKWNKEHTKIYQCSLELEMVDMVPMGYRTLYVEAETAGINNKSTTKDSYIENESFKVWINDDNKLVVKNKCSGRELLDCFFFEDGGDEGDTYDYSEPRINHSYYAEELTLLQIKKSELTESIEFFAKMKVPYNLEARKENNAQIDLCFTGMIKLKRKKAHIDFELEIENKAIEHRMRICFCTGIHAKESIADQQFGVIQRPTYRKEVESWIEEKWVEKPRTIEPMQSFVALQETDFGVAVMTDCVREYQIIGDDYDTIALTLFRSVPYMGKKNLQDRPGKASGMEWETPDATLLKTMSFRFSLAFYERKGEESLLKRSKEQFTPMKVYQACSFKNNYRYFIVNQPSQRLLNETYSLLEFENKNIILSSLKKAEERSGYILRMYNGLSTIQQSHQLIINAKNLIEKEQVQLDEKTSVSNDINQQMVIEVGTFKTYFIEKKSCDHSIYN